MKNNEKIKTNSGAAMIIVVFFFMFISLTILIGIVTPVVREFRIAKDNFDSKQAYFIAESGVEDIMYRVKNNMGVGTVGDDRELYLDETKSFVSIPTDYIDLGGGRKQITTTGDINSNQRTVNLSLTTSTGVSFNYGVLVGQGGVHAVQRDSFLRSIPMRLNIRSLPAESRTGSFETLSRRGGESIAFDRPPFYTAAPDQSVFLSAFHSFTVSF